MHNTLISMYGNFGQVDIARDLFNKMLERDDVSWNTVIHCYASKSMWGKASELFGCMWVEGVQLNFITWITIAGGLLRTGNFKYSLELLSQMRSSGNHWVGGLFTCWDLKNEERDPWFCNSELF